MLSTIVGADQYTAKQIIFQCNPVYYDCYFQTSHLYNKKAILILQWFLAVTMISGSTYLWYATAFNQMNILTMFTSSGIYLLIFTILWAMTAVSNLLIMITGAMAAFWTSIPL